MGRVVHFEIAADDVGRAKRFYEIFGWEIKDSGMPDAEYWLAATGTGQGIDGAIMPRSYSEQPVVNTIEVEDLDAMIAKVKSSGGRIVGEKQPIPGVGDFIYAYDTEGNKLGLLQPTKPI